MSSEAQKGIREMQIFERFVRQSGLAVVPGSIEKRPPGEPDIRCVIENDGPTAFELVEICDPNFAKFVATAAPDDGRYLRTSDPSRIILAKKLLRVYDPGCPLALLCYVNGGVITPDNVLVPTLTQILAESPHRYRRVWLLGRKKLYAIHDASAA